MEENERHCDDYIHDFKFPICLRVFLLVQRLPARDKMIMVEAGVEPKLFADFEGQTHRVTMASRFGDVGITKNLDHNNGYEKRVAVSALTNFRSRP